MRKELKELGREIASYPDQCFWSNLGDEKFLRLEHYFKSRTKRNISKADIQKAKKTLKVLKDGGQIIKGVCV